MVGEPSDARPAVLDDPAATSRENSETTWTSFEINR